MIKKITIRNVASYDAEGVTFEDLKKVNFIYGGNGCGKTTLSRLLASRKVYDTGFKLSGVSGTVSHDDPFENCDVKWDDDPVDVLVYNQDFKKRNLAEDMPGVFTIGENKWQMYRRKKNLYRKRTELRWRANTKEELDELVEREKEKLLDEKDLYSVEPSVDYMNELLEDHGFCSFRIKTSLEQPYFYQIQREDGTLASETLSEGEATIITFLYFLQLVEGSGSDYGVRKRKVVVIDDPISSLDYDAIDLVSTLVNEMIGKARNARSFYDKDFNVEEDGWVEQVIVMTHNTTFHQSLSVRQPRRNTHFWKLYKRKGNSKVTAYGEKNPVSSDYGLLWERLKEANENDNSMVMPNLMRRIVETYFVDYGHYDKGKLFAGAYTKNKEDKRTVVSLAKWFDEGSHGVNDNMYGVNGEVMCEKYMEMLRKFFDAMGQGEHYNMMMR